MGRIYRLEGTLRHLTNGTRGRVFPEELIRTEVERVKTIITEEGLLGEMGQPEDGVIRLDRITHKILNIDLKENLDYTIDIEILDTPSGQMVCDLIENGYVRPAFRAVAGETTDGPVFDLITFDIVSI